MTQRPLHMQLLQAGGQDGLRLSGPLPALQPVLSGHRRPPRSPAGREATVPVPAPADRASGRIRLLARSWHLSPCLRLAGGAGSSVGSPYRPLQAWERHHPDLVPSPSPHLLVPSPGGLGFSTRGAQTSCRSEDKEETHPRGNHTTGFGGTPWGCLSGVFERTSIRGSDTFLEAHGSGKKKGGRGYSLKKGNLPKPPS